MNKIQSFAAIVTIMALAVAASFAHAAEPANKSVDVDKAVAKELKKEALKNPDAKKIVTVSEETTVAPTDDGKGEVTTYTKVEETVGSRQEIRQNGEKIDPAQVKRMGRGNNYIQRSANNWTDESWTNDLDTKDVVNIENVHTQTTVIKETHYSNLNQ